ncbi:MAG: hypothetical protein ACW981_12110 [Candidatus Hodarchaeales archaeon]|jgi:DNA-directed RNA polymerase subunit RPC12/RpoP
MFTNFFLLKFLEMDYPPICPKCNNSKILIEKQSEYTGGGYADYWEEYSCEKCGHDWRSDEKTDYF